MIRFAICIPFGIIVSTNFNNAGMGALGIAPKGPKAIPSALAAAALAAATWFLIKAPRIPEESWIYCLLAFIFAAIGCSCA